MNEDNNNSGPPRPPPAAAPGFLPATAPVEHATTAVPAAQGPPATAPEPMSAPPPSSVLPPPPPGSPGSDSSGSDLIASAQKEAEANSSSSAPPPAQVETTKPAPEPALAVMTTATEPSPSLARPVNEAAPQPQPEAMDVDEPSPQKEAVAAAAMDVDDLRPEAPPRHSAEAMPTATEAEVSKQLSAPSSMEVEKQTSDTPSTQPTTNASHAPTSAVDLAMKPPPARPQQQQQQHQQSTTPAAKPTPAAAAAPPAAAQPPVKQQQIPPPPVGIGAAVAARAPPSAGFGGMRELRVEDALLYLDDVKREFGDRPRIYNEFLEIMKNFKSHEVDTPGVIDRVSRLFRGYNKLILGFNKFLPDGYKISLEDLERRDAEEARRAAAAGQPPPFYPGQQVRPPTMQSSLRPPGPPTYTTPRSSPPQMHQPSQPHQNPPSQPAMARGPPHPQQHMHPPQHGPHPPHPHPQQQQPPQPQHQAVEFDHAISYVTNIKKRFANDPGTYHAFLEILHTYQKEQRGIKEVLEQVASLFADHPDLLKEFTFFLPDAVQEQAKERLHRAAAESESRQAAAARGMGYAQQVIDMTGQPVYTESPLGRQRTPGSARKSPRDGLMVHPQQPETFVYNSAVERQFFDAVKEALSAYTRDGGQAWAEFLKCLDMYGQEILSRNEMLNFVEPLLGKRNADLFEEFKRILAAAGAPPGPAPSTEDSWYSVPLSEIDFSRCRRCSPSYRALPRDYPDPPCSDRSEEEAKVLNDVWVSLPVGSEESYTFRHMRRNQHEEVLFRCEDERFEIDMVIDSNACTLRRLEPIAEEIAQLSKEEKVTPDLLGPTKPSVDDGEGGGLGGLRFQYTFDKSILGVVHRNSISRIYGDAGPEMLELIVKNPTVAVPVVVQRLRQKDREWRAVRDRLNRHWKELAEQNYYKSLDNRSLTWRTTDKRATSTRTLLTEIKDRSENGGKESAAAIKARLDKNKEEHGSFFEVTMKQYLTDDLDLTNLPKPDSKLFTPHMSLMYEHDSWAQRDAYRILTFALERGNSSPADKEIFHRLWRDFLGPWFDLSLNWMQQPAVSFQESALSTEKAPSVVSNGDDSDEESRSTEDEHMGANVVTEEMEKDEEEEVDQWMDHHPLPAGAIVSTVYGEGRIKEFRRADSTYVVDLPLGTGYLRPHAVLCTVLAVEKSAYTNRLRDEDRSKMERPDDKLMIGTQSLYLFFRLHEILIRRLGIAKTLAYKVPHDKGLATLVEQMSGPDTGRRRYEAYLSLVYALLDGGGHSAEGKYEERVRCILGHGAYELATMDKLISHIVKNIQSIGNDETMQKLVQLFRRHLEAGSFKPDALRQEAAYLSDGELMYAFQGCKLSDGTDRRVLYMEYLGDIAEGSDDDEEEVEEGGSSEAMETEQTPAGETEAPPPPKRQRRS